MNVLFDVCPKHVYFSFNSPFSNDYYTPPGTISKVDFWIHQVKDCTIYEPFPGPKLLLINDLKKLGLHVTYRLGINAFGFEASSLWFKAQTIISNPPFNRLPLFFEKILRYSHLSFIIIAPLYVLSTKYFRTSFKSRFDQISICFPRPLRFYNEKMDLMPPGPPTCFISYNINKGSSFRIID